jgi:hypothetical protein
MSVDTTAVPLRRERPTWDLVLTIVLLVSYLILTLVASAFGTLYAFASDGCGSSNTCNYDQMNVGLFTAVTGVWGPVLFVVAGAIILLVIRRRAFWVPLVGILLTIGISALGAVLIFGAISSARPH